jgi:LuxR family transcriptional regulator of csgAB operon
VYPTLADRIVKSHNKSKTSKAHIQIVGPLKLQNELMAWFLHDATGLNCICGKDLDVESLPVQSKSKPVLVLLDCLSSDLSNLGSKLRVLTASGVKNYYLALFNVAAGQSIGNDLVGWGIRGLFYSDDPLTHISKGVMAILNGEFWFSRDTLVKYLLEYSDARGKHRKQNTFLTSRETEILLLLASGVSNNQIAVGLGISPHTVKTHIYNIYSKINVPNRLQAALWAAKNLQVSANPKIVEKS